MTNSGTRRAGVKNSGRRDEPQDDVPTPTDKDPRWQSVVSRDQAADGSFVYAVTTTGVYCRPSCASRTAKPGNVRFFDTPEEAEAAGFRACLRCRPEGRSPSEANAATAAEVCRLIEAADEPPKLEELAAAMGLSPSYLHRLFKRVTGLTPKQWGAANRARRVRSELRDDDSSVTSAIYGAGFSSSSRFYERSDEVLGMTPTTYKQGGQDTDIRFAVAQCVLGALLVAESDKGICAISLGDDPNELVQELQDQFPKANLIGADPEFEKLVAQVVGFVEAPQLGLDLPLDIRGTAFQQRVWQALRRVPAGSTVTYTDVAREIGEPKAVRAVAQACGANRIAVAIPCHRVVRLGGELSGYRWGVERKRALLEAEARAEAG